jgi:hypothetical protein
MGRVFLLSLILRLFLVLPVFAQSEKPIIRIESFTFEGINPQESQIIKTLFQSYLSTQGTLIYPEPDDPEASSDGEAGNIDTEIIPDFTFSAEVVFGQGFRNLRVIVGNVLSGETSMFNSSYRTTGELILRARAFIESTLAQGIPAPGIVPSVTESTPGGVKEQEIRAESMNERIIAGAWRGDHGIEMVRLWQGGRGLAVLSSGAQMELAYSIANNTLYVVQNSANHERYYHPLPYKVARILAARADPLRWEFLLYDNGAVLKGIQIITAVRYEGQEVLEMTPNSARESEWTKAAR